METIDFGNGIKIAGLIPVMVEGEQFYIGKASGGYRLYNAQGGGFLVKDIDLLEDQPGCSTCENSFIIGCVKVPKHFIEPAKKAFKEAAKELDNYYKQKENAN